MLTLRLRHLPIAVAIGLVVSVMPRSAEAVPAPTPPAPPAPVTTTAPVTATAPAKMYYAEPMDCGASLLHNQKEVELAWMPTSPFTYEWIQTSAETTTLSATQECQKVWIEGTDTATGVNTSDYAVKLAKWENPDVWGGVDIVWIPGMTTEQDTFEKVCGGLLTKYPVHNCWVVALPAAGGSDFPSANYSQWGEYPTTGCSKCYFELGGLNWEMYANAVLQQLDYIKHSTGSEELVLAGWSRGAQLAATLPTYAARMGKDLTTDYGITKALFEAPQAVNEVEKEFSAGDTWWTMLVETFLAVEAYCCDYDDSGDGGSIGVISEIDLCKDWVELWWADSWAPGDDQETTYGPVPPDDSLCNATNRFEPADAALESLGIDLKAPHVQPRPSADAGTFPTDTIETYWLCNTHDPYVPCGDTNGSDTGSDTIGMCEWLTGEDTTESPYCEEHLYKVDASHASWLVDPNWGAPNFWPAFDELMAEYMTGPAPIASDDADTADDVNDVDQLSVSEGEEEAINITFENVTEEFTIWFETAPVNALPFYDYTHVEGTQDIRIPRTEDTNEDGEINELDDPDPVPNEFTTTIYVQTTEDVTFESDQTFDLLVTTPYAAEPYSWPVTITDDDRLALDAQSVNVNEPDPVETVTVDVPVGIYPPQAQTLTLRYTTADGSAMSPGDYTAASGSISVAPYASTVTIPITVKGDSVQETAIESFTVLVSTEVLNPDGETATVSDTATVHIYPLADDPYCDGSGQYGC